MLIPMEVTLLQRDLISYKDSILLFRILMTSDILFVKISPKYFCESNKKAMNRNSSLSFVSGTHPCLLYLSFVSCEAHPCLLYQGHY